jgi:hypothetical protein
LPQTTDIGTDRPDIELAAAIGKECQQLSIGSSEQLH